MKYAVCVAIVNEEGEAVIAKYIGGYNDLYSLPEANQIAEKFKDILQERVDSLEEPEIL